MISQLIFLSKMLFDKMFKGNTKKSINSLQKIYY